MRNLFLSATLVLATLIAVSVSLSCSFWFFYTLIGDGGYPSIFAGLAGCTFQLFAYGFSSYILNIKRFYFIPIWFIFCLMPLLLPIFTTYTTLYGYINAGQQKIEKSEVRSQIILDMIEQNKAEASIIVEAAKQSVNERYRTQAERLLTNNKTKNSDNLALLDKLEETQSSVKTSPLDGLISVTGNSDLTKIVFCAWLSILFDILPVFAIATLSRKKDKASASNKIEDATHKEIQSTVHLTSTRSPLTTRDVPREESQRLLLDEQPTKVKKVMPHSSTELKEPVEAEPRLEPQDPTHTEADSDLYEELFSKIRSGIIVPEYSAIMDATGWTRWQTQVFFNEAKKRDIVEKKGKFLVVKEMGSDVSSTGISENPALPVAGQI